MLNFEQLVMEQMPEAAGKIEWPSAIYFFNRNLTSDEAAAEYITARKLRALMMDMEYEIGRLRQLAREIRSETWNLEVLAERTAAAIDHLANILSEIHEHKRDGGELS